MPLPAIPLALVLLMAAAIGFATQRGNVCSVLAARQIVELRQASRARAFILASLWSLWIVALLAWTTDLVAPARTYPLDILTLVGAVAYGAGTMLNGACVFGTAARILSGNLSFVATLFGVVIGGALGSVLQIRDLRVPAVASPLAMPTVAGAVAVTVAASCCAVALAHFWWRERGKATTIMAMFGGARWPTAVAMPVIGVLGGLLLASNLPWNYPVVLRGLGVVAAGVPVKFAAVSLYGPLAFVCGGVLAARIGGRAAWQRPVPAQVARCVGGGTLMGVAGYLLPGGNDVLLLYGLPSLSLHALVAYVVMLAVQISLAFAQQAWRTSRAIALCGPGMTR